MITLNPNNTIYAVYTDCSETLEGRVTSVDNLVTFLRGLYADALNREATIYIIEGLYIECRSDEAFKEFIIEHDDDFGVWLKNEESNDKYFYVRKMALSDLFVDI